MYRILLLSFLLGLCLSGSAVELVSSSLVKSYTKDELVAYYKKKRVPKFLMGVKYDIDLYKMLYKTPNEKGELVLASGLFVVPKGAKERLPLVSYQHGTSIRKNDAPSQLEGEYVIGMGMATNGYAVALPDYLGLGEGEGFHLYLHAQTEASASLDMILACKQFAKDKGIVLNDMLFLAGYSQGGHATMALHKMIEERYADELKVTASAPMSGPYDLTGAQAEVISEYREYSNPGYLPYVIFSYNRVYHLFQSPSEVFLPPYDTILPPLLDGTHGMNALNKAMPKVPANALKPEVVLAFKTDTASLYAKAMRDNNLYDWKPKAPVKMCYCEADEQVSYKNAFVAYEAFRKQGAKQVKKAGMGKKFNHRKCAYYSLVYSKMWFDSFRKGKEKGRKGPIFKRLALTLARPAVRKS
ncbi:MAG: lipase family protein [Chitinophagales bacterium]|nr:lipase family protein [Chitinophagales bacterium]